VYGAGATLGHAATEFGARQVRDIAQNPEQWHVRGDIQFLVLAIDVQGQHGGFPQTHSVLKGRLYRDAIIFL
jgi:hypothetical protein